MLPSLRGLKSLIRRGALVMFALWCAGPNCLSAREAPRVDLDELLGRKWRNAEMIPARDNLPDRAPASDTSK